MLRGAIECSVPTTKLMVQATCVCRNCYLRGKGKARRKTRAGCHSILRAEERGKLAGLANITDPGTARNVTRQMQHAGIYSILICVIYEIMADGNYGTPCMSASKRLVEV